MANRYTICIHMARTNSYVGRIENIPFVSAPPGEYDTVVYTKQKITIHANRYTKFTSDQILHNSRNSLYVQILKSLLFLYVSNKERIRIYSITIDRKTSRTEDPQYKYELEQHEQPLKGDFLLREDLPDAVKDIIWEESNRAYKLRAILSHYLGGLSSDDRYYIFERFWRTFEQLCFYHNRADSDNSDFRALAAMRIYVNNHLADFPEALLSANSLGVRDFQNFNWSGYIKNEFPLLAEGPSEKTYKNKFKVFFVTNNRDYRVIRMLEKQVPLRNAEMAHFNIDADVNNHISGLIAVPERHEENVLTMLCCKYAYYLRNKMFHGEIEDFTFSFSEGNDNDRNLDKLNQMLSEFNFELLMVFNNL